MKIRFLADYILCFSALTSALLLLSQPSAANDDLKSFNDSVIQKSQSDAISQYVKEAINANTTALENNAYLQTGSDMHAAMKKRITSIFSQEQLQGNEQIGDADLSKATFDTLVFASFSMPKEDLEQMYKACAGSERSTIVFRGLPPGAENITDAIRIIQSIAVNLNMKNPPNAVLNPVWFKQYNITSVPVILALNSKTDNQSGDTLTNKEKEPPKIKASVSGLINPTWLYERIDEGKTGDFGIQGPLSEIIERDLIDEMKERAAKIDWEEKKANAKDRMWNNIPITPLEKSLKYKKKLVDPTIIVKRDVLTPDGRYIAHKGDRINPLERRPFTRLLIAFDPTDKQEVEFIEKNLDTWISQRNILRSDVRLLMTNYDRDNKMTMYSDLTQRFDMSVFILTPEIKKTFLLERHPSIVYAEDLQFAVEEFDTRENHDAPN